MRSSQGRKDGGGHWAQRQGHEDSLAVKHHLQRETGRARKVLEACSGRKRRDKVDESKGNNPTGISKSYPRRHSNASCIEPFFKLFTFLSLFDINPSPQGGETLTSLHQKQQRITKAPELQLSANLV